MVKNSKLAEETLKNDKETTVEYLLKKFYVSALPLEYQVKEWKDVSLDFVICSVEDKIKEKICDEFDVTGVLCDGVGKDKNDEVKAIVSKVKRSVKLLEKSLHEIKLSNAPSSKVAATASAKVSSEQVKPKVVIDHKEVNDIYSNLIQKSVLECKVKQPVAVKDVQGHALKLLHNAKDEKFRKLSKETLNVVEIKILYYKGNK